MKTNKQSILCAILSILFVFSCTGCLAEATASSDDDKSDTNEITKIGANVPDPSYLSYSYSLSSDRASEETNFTCIINSPYEVHRYELKCDEATFLDVIVEDCCISGDLWQAKVKVWDSKPNTAITITPNKANEESVPARVYNSGGTNNNPKQLTALVECSYKSGVNIFPAASLFKTKSDGYCKLKDLGSNIKM